MELLTPISDALTHSWEKKCTKIANFLNQNEGRMEAHLQHLYGFAVSSGGLIKDEYREKIWPILVRNLPQAEIYPHSHKPSQHSIKSNDRVGAVASMSIDGEELEDNADIEMGLEAAASDSDFESALSNLSSSAQAGDADEPSIDEEEEEASTEHFSQLSIPDIPLSVLQSHSEWRQVELDVARTLARFPPNIDEERRFVLQEQLTKLIVRVLYENADFHYYQGFHDVCLTFLLVLGEKEALEAVQHVSRRGAFNNYLSCPLEESVLKELDDLYLLLYLHDHEVERRMRDVDLGTLFALSWPLTWFSHALQNYSQVVLLFDFLLCSHYLMPIYISAALVCERREEVLECEHEMPFLHKLLNEVPANINCHRVLDTARALFDRYPPTLIKELKMEYVQICQRQRRQRTAIENLELIQFKNIQEQILRRESGALRQNVYDIVKPFAVAGSIAAMAFAYYFVQQRNAMPI